MTGTSPRFLAASPPERHTLFGHAPEPLIKGLAFSFLIAGFASGAHAAPPDHDVVAIEENHSLEKVIGNPSAPYISSLAQAGAIFMSSYAITRSNQPNYVQCFSGASRGVPTNTAPGGISFSTPTFFLAPNIAES